MREGVAAVVIGSEVLTGKVEDANGPLLVKRLRDRGISLVSVHTVHDDVDAIVEAVVAARAKAKHVVTSGGIGPTHDDVTVRAVALALGRRVVRAPAIEEMIRKHSPGGPKEALRLADVPEGAELLAIEGAWLPVISCQNIYLLPGVPQLFRLQLETVLARIPGAVVAQRRIYLGVGEPVIAAALDRVALDMPDVAIGSYPKFGDADHRVMVTIESRDEGRVMLALERLRTDLPSGSILREG